MITIKNYDTEKNKIDWAKMPKAVSESRESIESFLDLYNDDADIKSTIDLYLEKINAHHVPGGTDKSKDAGSSKKKPAKNNRVTVAKLKTVKFVDKTSSKKPTYKKYDKVELIEAAKKEDKEFVRINTAMVLKSALNKKTGEYWYTIQHPNKTNEDLFPESDLLPSTYGKKKTSKTNKQKDNSAYATNEHATFGDGEMFKVLKFDKDTKYILIDKKTAKEIFDNNVVDLWQIDKDMETQSLVEDRSEIDEWVVAMDFDDARTFQKYLDNKKAPRKSTRSQVAELKHFKKFAPKHQQRAVMAMNSEELDSVILKLDDQLAEMEKQKVSTGKAKDGIVHAHYFYGGSDWFILDAQREGELFGYAILNGDAQMSELGYMSIDEIVNQGKVELDFYWTKKTLAEALYKVDPNYFDNPKAAPKNTGTAAKKTVTKKPTKKIEKAIDTKEVAHYAKDYTLIRRFYNLVSKKEVAPFNTIRLIYMAFNKAAVERIVRKSDDNAELFTKVNEKMVKLYDLAKDSDKALNKGVDIEFTDEKLLTEMETFVKEYKVNPAVTLLKSFISLQGYKPEVKKVENLLKRFNSALDKSRIETSNRLYAKVNAAKKALEKYLDKPTQKIEPNVFGLSAPRNVCTNRIKCVGLRNDGKLRKGYKFLLNGIVAKAKKKGLRGSEQIDYFEHYEKQPENVAAIVESYDLEEADYKTLEKMLKELNAIGWTFDYYLDAEPYDLRPIKKSGSTTIKKKSGKKKSKGLGEPIVLDSGMPLPVIQPERTVDNRGSAVSVLDIPVNDYNTVLPEAPLKTPMVASTHKNKLVKNMGQVGNTNNKYYVSKGDLSRFLGGVEIKPKESIVTTLDAPQGAMKTRLFFQFLNHFASLGYRCLFVSLEEHPDSALFKNKRDQYITPEAQKNIDTVGELPNGMKDFHSLVPHYDMVFTDSFGKLATYDKKLDIDRDIRKRYDSKWFFFIFQRTVTGTMRGGSAAQFDADMIMRIEKDDENYQNNYAFWNKNRYEREPNMKFNIFHKKMHTDNLAEAMQEVRVL